MKKLFAKLETEIEEHSTSVEIEELQTRVEELEEEVASLQEEEAMSQVEEVQETIEEVQEERSKVEEVISIVEEAEVIDEATMKLLKLTGVLSVVDSINKTDISTSLESYNFEDNKEQLLISLNKTKVSLEKIQIALEDKATSKFKLFAETVTTRTSKLFNKYRERVKDYDDKEYEELLKTATLEILIPSKEFKNVSEKIKKVKDDVSLFKIFENFETTKEAKEYIENLSMKDCTPYKAGYKTKKDVLDMLDIYEKNIASFWKDFKTYAKLTWRSMSFLQYSDTVLWATCTCIVNIKSYKK